VAQRMITMLFEGTAYAQSSGVPAGATPDLYQQILTSPVLPIAFIFVVMYLFLLRPQTKKAGDHQKMLSALKRNDEVVTTGGLIGKIADLGDKLITLEIAPNVRVRIERSQIASLSSYGKAQK
jgi:preprotein translocase subunit YajC